MFRGYGLFRPHPITYFGGMCYWLRFVMCVTSPPGRFTPQDLAEREVRIFQQGDGITAINDY